MLTLPLYFCSGVASMPFALPLDYITEHTPSGQRNLSDDVISCLFFFFSFKHSGFKEILCLQNFYLSNYSILVPSQTFFWLFFCFLVINSYFITGEDAPDVTFKVVFLILAPLQNSCTYRTFYTFKLIYIEGSVLEV